MIIIDRDPERLCVVVGLSTVPSFLFLGMMIPVNVFLCNDKYVCLCEEMLALRREASRIVIHLVLDRVAVVAFVVLYKTDLRVVVLSPVDPTE